MPSYIPVMTGRPRFLYFFIPHFYPYHLSPHPPKGLSYMFPALFFPGRMQGQKDHGI